MYIARILFPVKVLGPGNRIGIWFDGCSHNCKGCSNPELHEFSEQYAISLVNIEKLITDISNKNDIDGFTITGGDPFDQPEDLNKLLDFIRLISEDILIYTGYCYEDVEKKYQDIVNKATVIIDGEYVQELNTGEVLRGSTNQNIIILNDKFRNKYLEYIDNSESSIQNFYINGAAISVGIHKPGFDNAIDQALTGKGLISNG